MYALRRRIAFLVVLTVAVLAFAGAAHANGSHHHGNSGTVKVDDDEIDDQPSNHPHVVCALKVVITRTFGVPLRILFDAQAPTTRGNNDQRLLVLDLPDGNGVSQLIDLRGFLVGINPHPHQGFHVLVSLLLPGGGVKHKVIWITKDCPPDASTTTSTTLGSTTSTTKAPATTSTTTANASTTTTAVATNVLGEQFTKPPAGVAGDAGATQLANTGSPISPGLAGLLLIGGLGLGVAARAAGGRRLESSMRRSADRER